MRILYVVYGFPLLSQTFVLSEILAHLEAGFQVHVLSLSPPPSHEHWDNQSGQVRSNVSYARPGSYLYRLLQTGADTVRLAANHKVPCEPVLRSDRMLNELKEALVAYRISRALHRLNFRPDIIHCHFGEIGLYTLDARDISGISGKLVTTFHGFDLSETIRRNGSRVYDKLFQRGDMFLPISDFWKDRLGELGCDPKRTFVHRMGIDCSALRFECRTRTEGPVRLVTTGRLVEKKGHIYTLQALAILAQRRPKISWTLDVIGDGPDYELLCRAACELGIPDKVRFHGALSHKEALDCMRNSTLFVLPSVTANNGDMEGIPVVLMEASAMGMPVLTTSHSGIPELVKDGESGLLCAERDASGLSMNMETMLDHPERWPGFGRAARQRVETDFNRAALKRQLHDRYRCLLGCRASIRATGDCGSQKEGDAWTATDAVCL